MMFGHVIESYRLMKDSNVKGSLGVKQRRDGGVVEDNKYLFTCSPSWRET